MTDRQSPDLERAKAPARWLWGLGVMLLGAFLGFVPSISAYAVGQWRIEEHAKRIQSLEDRAGAQGQIAEALRATQGLHEARIQRLEDDRKAIADKLDQIQATIQGTREDVIRIGGGRAARHE